MALFENDPNILNPECPWTPLREWGGLPNVKWCEETLCSWVATPANTWSNLAFVFFAGVLWAMNRRAPERMIRFWAPASFWVGVTSLIYHASVSFVMQVLDFWGMYFFFVLVLLLNLLRMGTLPKERFFTWLWSLIFVLTAVTVAVAKVGLPVQGIIAVLLLSTLATEVIATKRSRVPVTHRFLLLGLGCIVVAGGFSVSDVTRAWCDPTNHFIQGHAVWHVVDSMGIFAAFFHYRQFRGLYL